MNACGIIPAKPGFQNQPHTLKLSIMILSVLIFLSLSWSGSRCIQSKASRIQGLVGTLLSAAAGSSRGILRPSTPSLLLFLSYFCYLSFFREMNLKVDVHPCSRWGIGLESRRARIADAPRAQEHYLVFHYPSHLLILFLLLYSPTISLVFR